MISKKGQRSLDDQQRFLFRSGKSKVIFHSRYWPSCHRSSVIMVVSRPLVYEGQFQGDTRENVVPIPYGSAVEILLRLQKHCMIAEKSFTDSSKKMCKV